MEPRGEPVFSSVHYGTSGMKIALARLNKAKLTEQISLLQDKRNNF